MTFLSGFAEGFINERNRRLEREADIEDTQFKYGMDALVENRERREKKRLEETEMARKASDLGTQFNDPAFAPAALKELKNGVSYEELQKRYADGAYQKNPNYKPKETTYQIPRGVAVEEELDAGMNLSPKVKARMDQIDPTLRKGVVDSDPTYTALNDEEGNAYVYKPQGQMKFGSMEKAQYALMQAEAANDPVAIRDAKMQIKAHEIGLTIAASKKAQAENLDSKTYIMKDPKTGNLISTFQGRIKEDGKLYNITNQKVDEYGKQMDQIVTAEEMGTIQMIDPKSLDALADVQEKVGKQGADLNDAQSNYVGAINTTKGIMEILDRNPEVANPYVGGTIKLINDLEGGAKDAYQALVTKKEEIKQKIESEDYEGIEGMMAEYRKGALDFEKLISSNDSSILTDRQRSIAHDKALYDTRIVLASFQFAQANGISAGKMSNQDYDRINKAIGGESTNALDVIRGLQGTAQSVLTVLDGRRTQLNNLPMIKDFHKLHGFNTGIEQPSIQDLMIQMGREDLVPSFKEVSGSVSRAQANAAADAQRQAVVTPPAGAIAALKKDKTLAAQFDQKYGEGAAALVLGE